MPKPIIDLATAVRLLSARERDALITDRIAIHERAIETILRGALEDAT